MSDPSGVVFPLDPTSGRRSTTATGRAVVADALRAVDPVGAASAERETNWRQGYLAALPPPRRGRSRAPGRRATDRGDAASTRCTTGCAGRDPDGDRPPRRGLRRRRPASPPSRWRTETVRGEGDARPRLSVPYAGERLSRGRPAPPPRPLGRGRHRRADLRRGGRAASSTTPTGSTSSDRTVVVLGAAAEMGPLRSLLRWGADVAAVDLPRKDLWDRLIADTRRLAGSITVPVRRGSTTRRRAGRRRPRPRPRRPSRGGSAASRARS